jgi:hypothetical protein
MRQEAIRRLLEGNGHKPSAPLQGTQVVLHRESGLAQGGVHGPEGPVIGGREAWAPDSDLQDLFVRRIQAGEAPDPSILLAKMLESLLEPVHPIPKLLKFLGKDGVLTGQMVGSEIGSTVEEQKPGEGEDENGEYANSPGKPPQDAGRQVELTNAFRVVSQKENSPVLLFHAQIARVSSTHPPTPVLHSFPGGGRDKSL